MCSIMKPSKTICDKPYQIDRYPYYIQIQQENIIDGYI